MNERIQKVLDGDIEPPSLTMAERAMLLETESAITAVVRAVPVDSLPDLGASVVRRLAARNSASARVHRNGVPGVLKWLWRPRPITLRPAYALAAAAIVAVLLTAPALMTDRSTSAEGQQVFTQFVLTAPDAKQVSLAGDFTDWKPAFVMQRSEPGVWTVVVPLTPGVHTYSFVVDGERWVADPMAPAVDDGFGGRNSRLAVFRPERRS